MSTKLPDLLQQVRNVIRVKHYALNTEKSYISWIERFILFHKKRHPASLGAKEIGEFLTHLAVNRRNACYAEIGISNTALLHSFLKTAAISGLCRNCSVIRMLRQL